MTVILRKMADRPPLRVAPSACPSALGVVCGHCLSPLGESWRNGKVRLPSASFVRPDGRLETRCAKCERYTTLPYQRVTPHD